MLFPIFHVKTKCIYVNESVHSRLMQLKYTYGFRNMSELLTVMLDYIEKNPQLLRGEAISG